MSDALQLSSQSAIKRPRLMAIFWAYRKVLVIGALAGLALGFTMALLRPTTYTSSGTLLFPSAPASRLALLPGSGGGDLPSVPLLEGALMIPQPGTSASTAAMLLQSRRARKDVVRILKQLPGTEGVDLEKHWGMGYDAVLANLRLHQRCTIGKQGELYVGFSDGDPAVAAKISRAFIDELVVLTGELRLDPARGNVSFLEEQANAANKKLQKVQNEMLAFQRKYRIVDLNEQAKAVAAQYSTLQDDITRAKLEAMVAVRQANLSVNNAGTLIQACVDPTPGPSNTLSPLYQKVTQAESELALLKEKYTPNHPDVQAQGAVLQEAKRQLQREINRQLALLKVGSSPAVSGLVLQAAAGQAKVAGMQAAVAQLQKQMDNLPQMQAIYARMVAEAQVARDEYTLFRQELEKARIVAQKQGPTFTMLDQPEQPHEADPAGRMMLLVGMLILGVTLSSLIPYWKWYTLAQEYEDAQEQQIQQTVSA